MKPEMLGEVMAKIKRHIDYLASLEAPGSVICEIHCDSTGPRKVVVTLQEAHPVKDALAPR